MAWRGIEIRGAAKRAIETDGHEGVPPKTGREGKQAMRRINPTILLILPLALALMLGTAPPEAEAAAKACKNLKFTGKAKKRNKGGCVTSKDVKDGDLSHNQVKNMAGQRSFEFGGEMKVPTEGWLIISASTQVDATGATGPIIVTCSLEPVGVGIVNRAPYSVVESINPDEGPAVANISATKVYEVRVSDEKVDVIYDCGPKVAPLTFRQLGISARFVPTKY